ncbi:uncharacterized protein VTP21DRAFT_9330 [Calcarisporiella thermophila]|uniref:uncharacterized protein n=1 Tax=Calcarisporiella thermophila TaxID=911321 RepID=UPI0037430BA5
MPSRSRSRSRVRQKRYSRSRSPEFRSSKRYNRSYSRSRSPDERRSKRRHHSRSRERRNNDRSPSPKEEEMKITAAPAPPSEPTAMQFNLRSGGAYIPPHRLRMMQQQLTDKSSPEYQRMAWEALKKSINGLINKVNTSNIKVIIPELFGENLVRGRGLFARSIMKAQAAATPFTPVYAALVAVINTKLPQVGELLVKRLIIQFRRAFKRNDKNICLTTTSFIAHLTNQFVVEDILSFQILALLTEQPTDDSVEVAVGFMKEVGAHLADYAPKINNAIFDRLRAILREGTIDKRIQYMIEVLFQVRKDRYKDNPPIAPELDLVEETDQITHDLSLDEELEGEERLNVFQLDPDYMENEQRYAQIKAEILGEGSDEEGSEEESDEEDEDEEDDTQTATNKLDIHDKTDTNLSNLRRKIYLTIMSSVDHQECCHKLMKLNLEEGQEKEFCNMIIACCSQERTFMNFYGLIGERMAKINRVWSETFEACFSEHYETIYRYENNQLRNISKFFHHLLATDSISWTVLSCITLTEDGTTSSSRIFLMVLFQELSRSMGVKALNDRLQEPEIREKLGGLFPQDNPKNTRFAINYFTAIGLGALTDELREWLKNAPRLIMERRRAQRQDSDSSSGSSSGSDSSDDSDSSSDSDSESSSRSDSDSD